MPEAVKDLLAGVASIFDFKDAANNDMDVRRPEQDDYTAMHGDWALVGDDLWKAVEDSQRERSTARE